MKEIKLMKGNEAVAMGAVHAGSDAYYGYPITPQSEVIETLMEMAPWNDTGMVVLQAESEVASINMVYGAAACGKKVMTSSSSPGVSLMSEGMSYIAGAELPCVLLNVQRGGPGLGTIQPSQSDYFQAVKGGGHGDFQLIVLAPYSVQEMYDHVFLGYELAFKYRNPVMILSDGVIGQMMEKVVVREQMPRMTDKFIEDTYGSWALTGKTNREKRNVITSLELDPNGQERFNEKLQAKYAEIRRNEQRYETIMCEDAEYVIVAFGCSARIAHKAVQMAREEGYKVGLLRPITLYPFPEDPLRELAKRVKGFLSVELNAGQMVQDVRLSVGSNVLVDHYGRMGGIVHSPGEVLQGLKDKIISKLQ